MRHSILAQSAVQSQPEKANMFLMSKEVTNKAQSLKMQMMFFFAR